MTTDVEIVATGLRFPEGPVMIGDGSLLVVETAAGVVSRILPSGRVETVADVGAGPNGAAIGPDGALYVCNNGGLEFTVSARRGWHIPGHAAHDYKGGSIQRVELDSGAISTLYDRCGHHSLKGPNDLVFDALGWLWFTDHGKTRPRERDLGGVYRARPDGSEIFEVIFPLETPNGIGLAPDGSRLYVAETVTRSIWAWDIDGGRLVTSDRAGKQGGRLLFALADSRVLDSLAVDADGNVCVGALGTDAAILTISPDGLLLDQRKMPDPFPTNLCFGLPGTRHAFVTLSAAGQLGRIDWPADGAQLAYSLASDGSIVTA